MKECIIKTISILLMGIFCIMECCVILLTFFLFCCAITEPFKFDLDELINCMVISCFFHILPAIDSFIMIFFSKKLFKIMSMITVISYVSMTLMTTVIFSSSPDFLGMLR